MSTDRKRTKVLTDDDTITSIEVNPAKFEQFLAKIRLSNDIKKIANSVRGDIVVTWAYGAANPSVCIVERNNLGVVTQITDYETIRAVSGYRGIARKTMETIDEQDASLDKIVLIRDIARECEVSLEDTMQKKNRAKIAELDRQSLRLGDNLEELMELRSSPLLDYVICCIEATMDILIDAMGTCVETKPYDDNYVTTQLSAGRIPHWIYKTFSTTLVSTQGVETIEEILWPKNFKGGFGYLKRELEDAEFLYHNYLLADPANGFFKILNRMFCGLTPLTGRDAMASQEKFFETFYFAVPNQRDLRERFEGHFGAPEVNFDDIKIIGNDSESLVRRNVEPLARVNYAFKCFENYQFNYTDLKLSAEMLGIKFPKGMNQSVKSLAEYAIDYINEDGLNFIYSDEGLEAFRKMVHVELGDYMNEKYTACINAWKISGEMPDKLPDDLLERRMNPTNYPSDAEIAIDKFHESEENFTHKLGFRMKDDNDPKKLMYVPPDEDVLTNYIREMKTRDKFLEDLIARKVIVKHHKGFIDDRKRRNRNDYKSISINEKEKIKTFLNIRPPKERSDRGGAVLKTEPDTDTMKILDKIKSLPGQGDVLYKDVLKWITEKFYNRNDLQRMAAEATYNCLKDLDYLTEESNE